MKQMSKSRKKGHRVVKYGGSKNRNRRCKNKVCNLKLRGISRYNG